MLILILSLLYATPGQAEYPRALANENLRQELSSDPNRIIPQWEYVVAGVDGDAWARMLGINDFYHGMGYWLQARTEAQPSPHFRLNVRTILYSGSSSEGYSYPTGFYNLIGVTGYLPPLAGFRISARIVDIGRQNVGAGLLIQDREMNGILAIAEKDWFHASFRLDSTGALVFQDDVHIYDIRLFGGWFGAGAALWPASVEQSGLAKNRGTYTYLYSKHSLNNVFSYAFELGRREKANGALASLGAAETFGPFRFRTKLEYRYYGKGIGKDFVRQIEHQYISYDQYDKPYTNSMNLFVQDDHAQVYAAHADLFLRITHHWRIESLNELGSFAYKANPRQNYYFYRAGLSYCPLKGRDDCVTAFASNKVLSDSYVRPPGERSLNNLPLFKRFGFFGIDANFRF